jgi:hypothetical protein
MRKLIALLLVLGVAVFSGNFVYAQDANESEEPNKWKTQQLLRKLR